MLEKMRYCPERYLAKEGIKKIGVAVFIVDLNSEKIWLIRENKEKASTGRKAGCVSIPLETRKKGESIMKNTLGALEEFREFGDKESLVWIDGLSYKGRYPFIPGVMADIVVVGLQNARRDEALVSKTEEVTYVGWKNIAELTNCQDLRDGVDKYIELCQEKEWLQDFNKGTLNETTKKRTIDREEIKSFLEERCGQGDYGN